MSYTFRIGDIVRVISDGDGVDDTIGYTGVVSSIGITIQDRDDVSVQFTEDNWTYLSCHLELEVDPERIKAASNI